jgi:hypothetical protein
MTMIANEARREDGKIADIGAYVNEDVVGVDAELRACLVVAKRSGGRV